ncbi:MAG: CHAT domain-containing protein [Caldilineaceae bacterium]|nr:CHAT domain-containing protein [Caldilineaceae bacterium]MBP8107197.1 CHAT domain-containing protein [Caldilineaceae bacterium]MBP8122232.1 CHAT domain-containing protein [Caldilineaceae bacterium]MBP9072803.1 CHAT domain-containing protein [Caldilineaceae bacterium]
MPPLNLDLHFHRSPYGYRVRLDSPMGQTSADFDPPVSAQEKAQGQGSGPQEIGGRIFRALFKGGAETLLQRNLDHARSQETTLRIRLRLNDTPELVALPWETLHDPARQRFLALSTESTVLRYLELPDPPPPLQAPRPLRILGVLASPHGMDALNLDGEWDGLAQALAPSIERGEVVLDRLDPPTLDHLRRRLRQEPPVHLLHFAGHALYDATAQTGMLVLADEAGNPATVTGTDLAIILHNAASLRLVFLNACEGGVSGAVSPFTGVAGALVQQGVPGVIAMQQVISDRGGIRFAQELYSALADGLSVDAAITQGRMALHSLGDHEWPIPVFFTRTPDDRLFGPDPSLADRHFTVPFPRNHGFVGREEDLAHLHTALQGAETVGIRPAGLTGQGGIGKTQLAVEYCYRHFHDRDDYPGGIFWVNAAEDWRQGFAALGRRVEPDCAERPTEQQIQAAARYLRSHPDALLVLDNVADPARLLRPVIPELIPATLPGPVLFTTRRRDLGRFQPVEVSVLPPGPALALLLSHPSRADVRQPHHPEHATAQEICRILGGLPLALEIAAAHLGKRPTQPVAAYRDALLNRGALAVVDDRRGGVRDEDLGTRHAAAVAATLAEQWELVQSEDARLLLRIAGQLPEAAQIPTARLGLLANISDEEDGFFGSPLASALTELADVSLIEPLTADAIRLHPSVREFAAGLTLSNEVTGLRQTCADNLFKAFSDATVLERQFVCRGMHALELDIRTTISLLRDLALTTLTDSLTRILRLFERTSHEVKNWTPVQSPAFFAQQIYNRTGFFGLTVLRGSTAVRLADLGAGYMALNWASSRANPALIRTLMGHKATVWSVAVTSDGRRAVSASSDRTVRVWDLESGENVATLMGHESLVTSVAVTPDGRRAVSASIAGTVRVWDLGSGKSIATQMGHKVPVIAVTLTPDGKRVVSALSDGTVRVWDLGGGESTAKMIDKKTAVMSVVVTLDGRRAVSSLSDGTLRVWDLDSGASVATLAGHVGRVPSVVVTSDGRRAVSASDDGTLRVWDLETGESVATLTGHKATVWSVAVTSDGQRAVSASYDRTLRVWDLESGKCVAILTGHEDGVKSVAVTPDGQRAVSASYDCTVRVWDISLGQIHFGDSESMANLKHHKSSVTALAVTSDGRRTVSASNDGMLRVWDLKSGESVATLTGHKATVWSVAVTPDGHRAVSASHDGTIRVWDLESGKCVTIHADQMGAVWSVAVTPDGHHAVLGRSDGVVQVWDLEVEGRVMLLTGHEMKRVLSVAVTPDGCRAMSASDDRTVRVWDLSSGENVATLSFDEPDVAVLSVTSDGRRAVSATNDGMVRVWDPGSGEIVAMLTGHESSVRSVVVSPDGRQAVSASDDRTVRVWDLEFGHQLAKVALDGAIQAVAIAPDGVTIVAGDVLGNVYCLTYVPAGGG